MNININEIKVKAGWSKRVFGASLFIEQDGVFDLPPAWNTPCFVADIIMSADLVLKVDTDEFRRWHTKALLSDAIEF